MMNFSFGFIVLSFDSKEETVEFINVAEETGIIYSDVNYETFEVEVDCTMKENLQMIINVMN